MEMEKLHACVELSWLHEHAVQQHETFQLISVHPLWALTNQASIPLFSIGVPTLLTDPALTDPALRLGMSSPWLRSYPSIQLYKRKYAFCQQCHAGCIGMQSVWHQAWRQLHGSWHRVSVFETEKAAHGYDEECTAQQCNGLPVQVISTTL